jgi:hypothetical protein
VENDEKADERIAEISLKKIHVNQVSKIRENNMKNQHRYRETIMEQIASTKKYQNGIQVFWTSEGKELSDFFPYEALIEMKINAFDLLENPKIYRIDAKNHRIESSV